MTTKDDREQSLACPTCGKPMAHFKAVVIASKNCPYCGARVLDDIS